MSKPDLNLILIFDAIMREQSITIAAEQLAMTQPSVSKAVSRMRYIWKDPLFVKKGRGIQPTPYAINLWETIANPIKQIEQAVTPQTFDPMKTRTQLRVALTDGVSYLFWPHLRRVIEQRAKAIDLYAVPFRGDGEQLLLDAHVDLVLDYYPTSHPHIHSKLIFENHFTCVMPPSHPRAKDDMSLETFCTEEHLLVSLSGDPKGIVDSRLKEMNLSRRVAITVNSFSSAIHLLKQSNLMSVMPRSVVCGDIHAGTLIEKPLPLVVPPAPISIAWHKRSANSQALKWLINEVHTCLSEQSAVFNWMPVSPK